MKIKLILLFILISTCYACKKQKEQVSISDKSETQKWRSENLNLKAMQQLDSSKWDVSLFKQDRETYEMYQDYFNNYPLNKTPFPVADYDYAVSSIPFTIEKDRKIIKGVRIGECENFDCEKIIDKLTLMVLTNNKDAEELSLVESRNFPYLTAQGFIKVSNNDYDWVFSASPDGFATLIINMKLFDLRFGETVIIYPQSNKSFFYDQIKDSPNHYYNFEAYKIAILNLDRVKHQLNSEDNIKL